MKSFLLQKGWLLGAAVLCCAGCSAEPAAPEKTPPRKITREKTPPGEEAVRLDFRPQGGFYAHLLPAETVGYVRIREAQQVLQEFIRPQHLRDAARIQQRLNELLRRQIQQWGAEHNAAGLSGTTLLRLLSEVQEIHIAFLPQQTERSVPAGEEGRGIGFLILLRMSSPEGLRRLTEELQPKLDRRIISGHPYHVFRDKAAGTWAFCIPMPQTLLLGSGKMVERLLSGTFQQEGRTLDRQPSFRRAVDELKGERPLFVFADFQVLRRRVFRDFPLPTVGGVAGTLGLDGGLTLRAYAAEEKEFPAFLSGGNRERKFLARIPAEAVFLISHKISHGHSSRRNFMEWLATELKGAKTAVTAWVPSPWAMASRLTVVDPNRIESQAFAIMHDLWNSGIPAQSETAWFVAPDERGCWGTAFLFDVKNRDAVRRLVENVFRSPARARLPWKKLRSRGLTIHYLDFEEIARQQGQPVSPRLKKLAQLQVGYAEDENLFYVGTVSAIEFAHHPQGKTLADTLPEEQVAAQNTLLILLQPGRVLHSTFGVEQVDRLLARFAAEIPPESFYAVTLQFEPRRLTFRSNIPFISFAGWLMLEALEEKNRPAPALRPQKSPRPVPAPRPHRGKTG